MIVSFHPLFDADHHILCAGREPGPDDLAWIGRADAVILPQGCRRDLYDMAKKNCPHVFPNYDARFSHPGKTAQVRLFQQSNCRHPATHIYPRLNDFHRHYRQSPSAFPLPFVFKFDWGGEGENIYFIDSQNALKTVLNIADRYEQTGQSGFLIQEYIPSGSRCLRVAALDELLISYWRVQPERERFGTAVARGAVIDRTADPDLQEAGRQQARNFCDRTGINLAGIDLIFNAKTSDPYFIEINYFFGRAGLGGSKRYYALLKEQIGKWLQRMGVLGKFA